MLSNVLVLLGNLTNCLQLMDLNTLVTKQLCFSKMNLVFRQDFCMFRFLGI
uniref:Uncharacterized protein n=2 Tax=Anguilla anguilla TaxID=7936 RepID=A0A0E9PW46_ANGAN